MTMQVLSSEQGSFNLKVDVDLLGLPNAPYGGHEVVVNFHINDFENN